jgi:dienelactone hydrolase
VAWWPAWAWLLTACTLDAEKKAPATLPTGHYEGQVSYQGTELRTVLDLREARPGQLQADVSFPDMPDLDFTGANLIYTEPQLRFDEGLPTGGIDVTAVQEGDFLRGVFTLDSVRVDFVWVRRGQPEARAYQQKQLAAQPRLGAPALTLLVPNDTVSQHSAVALFTDAAHEGATTARAAQLARQGFLTTVVTVQPTALPDSATLQAAAAVLVALRRAPATDTTRIGLWVSGSTAAAVAPAATLPKPAAAFVVLENVPIASGEEAKPFQVLARQRIPVLALYAAADTSLNAATSTSRLRAALGARRSTLRAFPKADANFRVPGSLNSEGKWTWPQPASGYVEAIRQWRK